MDFIFCFMELSGHVHPLAFEGKSAVVMFFYCQMVTLMWSHFVVLWIWICVCAVCVWKVEYLWFAVPLKFMLRLVSEFCISSISDSISTEITPTRFWFLTPQLYTVSFIQINTSRCHPGALAYNSVSLASTKPIFFDHWKAFTGTLILLSTGKLDEKSPNGGKKN